jgi:2,5-diamino-6-(ribosylamino)-4(3H)-pyrimidinone 5'-phosphate reductase
MKRPYVIINCAMSADGKIALPNRKQVRISSDKDIARMYKLRNECDAVLVGVETILSDDPKLTIKEKYVKKPSQPLRVILDTKCRTPEDALAVNGKAKTIIFTKDECKKKFNPNVETKKCRTDKNGMIELKEMLEILFQKGIKKLMVEGGGTVIWNFLKQGLVDDMYVYIGPIIIGGKETPTLADGNGIFNEKEKIRLDFADMARLGEGILIHYKMIK